MTSLDVQQQSRREKSKQINIRAAKSERQKKNEHHRTRKKIYVNVCRKTVNIRLL